MAGNSGVTVLVKIVLTVVIFVVGSILITILDELQNPGKSGSQMGPLRFVLLLGLIAAITAIWKYKPEK